MVCLAFDVKKFCLKANYVDFSQARNVVSGMIYGQMAGTRLENTSPLYSLPNCGAVDGYPIMVYLNGEFYGLYTFNIPKDKWMFGMSDSEDRRTAILMADTWSKSTYLFENIAPDYVSSGWELEYCSTADDSWAADSFNRLIECLNMTDREAMMELLPTYLDIDSAIDVLLLTMTMLGEDNLAKNILYVTYDGIQWIVSPYDMDRTWGMYWDTSHFYPNDTTAMIPTIGKDGKVVFSAGRMQLWNVLFSCYGERIINRWNELKDDCLSAESLKSTFDGFFSGIPDSVYELDRNKWQEVPLNDMDHREQIFGFIDSRMAIINGFFEEWSLSMRAGDGAAGA